MNKGRTGVDNSALSKPTWEIMKIISDITDFCWELISGSDFWMPEMERSGKVVVKNFSANMILCCPNSLFFAAYFGRFAIIFVYFLAIC